MSKDICWRLIIACLPKFITVILLLTVRLKNNIFLSNLQVSVFILFKLYWIFFKNYVNFGGDKISFDYIMICNMGYLQMEIKNEVIYKIL